MSELNPYLVSLYFDKMVAHDLPSEHLRKHEVLPALFKSIDEILSYYHVADLATSSEVAELVFAKMVEGNVFQLDDIQFAGKYYRYSDPHYKSFRGSFRQNDAISLTGSRIGERFYPDVFDGFRALAKEPNISDISIPASDRVVRLDDNQPEVVEIREQATELVEAFSTGNDFGDLTSEEVEVAKNESVDLQAMLSKKIVRSSTISEYSIRALRWVAEKAAGTAVGKIAWALLVLIAAFFGFTV